MFKNGVLWGEIAFRWPRCGPMTPNETSAPICYNSVYRHGVDEKRRIQVPAKWRPDGDKVEFTLVIWPKEKAGVCLRVLPPEKMQQTMKELDAMPNSDPNKGILKRFIGNNSEQVTLDKAGRICLPEKMTTAAGVKGEAVLAGSLDKFEVWSPDRYRQVETSDAVMAADAFRLME